MPIFFSICVAGVSDTCFSLAMAISGSGAWVMAGMQLPQALPCDVGINLRSRYVGVSQQHLHDSEVRAMIEQVGGKCVTQDVRRQGGMDVRPQRVLAYELPECLAGHGSGPARHEEGVGSLRSQQGRPGFFQIALDPILGFRTHRPQAVLAPLAEGYAYHA